MLGIERIRVGAVAGDVIVPEALVPVHCDAEHDHAVYVEPNVWVEHVLSD